VIDLSSLRFECKMEDQVGSRLFIFQPKKLSVITTSMECMCHIRKIIHFSTKEVKCSYNLDGRDV
jgi:hypothetical protein